MVVSTQHDERVSNAAIAEGVESEVVRKVIPELFAGCEDAVPDQSERSFHNRRSNQ